MVDTPVTSSGKMFPEHSQATRDTTSMPSFRNSRKLPTPTYMSLDLRAKARQTDLIGDTLEASWETGIPSHGELLMLNTGEYPSAVVESTLSQILQENVPEKYCLSARACQGILNRAERRGKKLPEMLEAALLEVVNLPPPNNSAGFVGGQGAKSGSVGFEENVSPTLRQGITTDVVYESWSMSAKQQSLAVECECAATIGANDYKEPQVVFDITGTNSNSMKSPTPDSCFRARDVGRTLDTFVGSPECNQGGMVVVSGVDCRNMTLNEQISGTLQAKGNGGYSLNYQNPILCLNDQGGAVMSVSESVTATLRAQEHGHQPIICKEDNEIV